tara:strand:- start:1559 stop:2494 length:936 start_codon:yes stop_codon:yes gene_type:complete
MNKKSKIYIAGHNGMVGSSILRLLKKKGYKNIVTKTSRELNLVNQEAVSLFFETEKPEYIFLAAAKVGGIYANDNYRADFIYDNLMIQTNVIHSAFINKSKKLLFLGSSCIYPKNCGQPIKEDYLLNGKLESTNQPYAIAKISGIEMCNSYRYQYGCNFISAMPTNLYGTNDNYHAKNSHVLPSLIRKVILAKKNNKSYINVWGDGSPLREFLHVDDLAEASLFLMKNYNKSDIVNVGSGLEISIKNLSKLIIKKAGSAIDIKFDKSKPNGTIRKFLDTSKILKLGWSPKINLDFGIEKTINEYKEKLKNE